MEYYNSHNHYLPDSNIVDLVVATTILILALAIFIYFFFLRKPSSFLPPMAGGAWPILGHLPLLGGSQPPHITPSKLADKYGPIFTINMGVYRALIISNSEIAKECFTTNDIVFANRPKTMAFELLGYGNTMFGFCSYGPYWRQVRKLAALELLSNHRLQTLSHVRESEIKAAIKEIHDRWVKDSRVLVDMKKWFGD